MQVEPSPKDLTVGLVLRLQRPSRSGQQQQNKSQLHLLEARFVGGGSAREVKGNGVATTPSNPCPVGGLGPPGTVDVGVGTSMPEPRGIGRGGASARVVVGALREPPSVRTASVLVVVDGGVGTARRSNLVESRSTSGAPVSTPVEAFSAATGRTPVDGSADLDSVAVEGSSAVLGLIEVDGPATPESSAVLPATLLLEAAAGG